MEFKLIKHFRNLTLWQILGRLINIIYFSILTLKLGPYNYGFLALILSLYEIASIGFIGINNGLQKYISEKHQWGVLISSLKLAIGFSFVMAIFLFIFRNYLSLFLAQNVSAFMIILGILLLMGSFKEVISNALFGLKEINYYIIVDAALNIFKLVLVSLFLYLSLGISGVLFGLTLANLLSGLIALFLISKVNFSKTAFNIKRLVNYSGKFILLSFLYQFQPQVFIFYLSKFSSIVDVGYYKFLYNLISTLVILTPQTLALLVFPYISELVYKKKYKKLESLFGSYFKIVLYASLISSLLFYVLIGFVVKYFFKAYTPSLKFVPLFLVFGIVQSLNYMSSNLVKATESLNYFINVSIIVLITSLIFTPILIKFLGVNGAVLSYSLVLVLITWFLTKRMLKHLNIKLNLLPTKSDIILMKHLLKELFTK